MRLLQFTLDRLTRCGLVCLAFKRIRARRRSVAASVCHTIKAFCKQLLALLYACLLYNRQDCCHSPGIVWACLLCNQRRYAAIQPAGRASVTGSPQQARASQRTRPPDCTQFPRHFAACMAFVVGLHSLSRVCLQRVYGGISNGFVAYRFMLLPSAWAGCAVHARPPRFAARPKILHETSSFWQKSS